MAGSSSSRILEEVVPLAIGEALRGVPEEQSHTPTIEGLLGDLTLEVEATKLAAMKRRRVELDSWQR